MSDANSDYKAIEPSIVIWIINLAWLTAAVTKFATRQWKYDSHNSWRSWLFKVRPIMSASSSKSLVMRHTSWTLLVFRSAPVPLMFHATFRDNVNHYGLRVGCSPLLLYYSRIRIHLLANKLHTHLWSLGINSVRIAIGRSINRTST